MAEGEIDKPSFFSAIVGILICIVLVIFGGYSLWTETFNLINELSNNAEVVTFSKGAMYGLGGVPGLSIMLYLGAKASFGFGLTEKERTIGAWILGVSLFVFLLFPHIAEFSVNHYVVQQGYEKCDLLSHQWLHVKTVVYTITPEFCREP